MITTTSTAAPQTAERHGGHLPSRAPSALQFAVLVAATSLGVVLFLAVLFAVLSNVLSAANH